jgi:chaperonin cofactor prefoldin
MAETLESRVNATEARVDTLMETLASQLHSVHERLSDMRAILIGVLAIQAAQLAALVALALRR